MKLPSEEEGGGAGDGRGGGVGAPGRGVLLKICVKPSADTESETPCAENPFDFDGPAGGGSGRAMSSDGRGGGAGDGVAPATKIRVNSPCPALACDGWGCGCGRTTCTVAGDAAGGAGAGDTGRCCRLLNKAVNSLCPAGEPAGAGAGLDPFAAGDRWGERRSAIGSAGAASCGVSCSTARRNIPVALKGSGCSRPELELLFVMIAVLFRVQASILRTEAFLSAGTPEAGAYLPS